MQKGNLTIQFLLPLGRGSQDSNMMTPASPLFMLIDTSFLKPLFELYRLKKLLKIAEVTATSQKYLQEMVGFYELSIGEQSIEPPWNQRMRPIISM